MRKIDRKRIYSTVGGELTTGTCETTVRVNVDLYKSDPKARTQAMPRSGHSNRQRHGTLLTVVSEAAMSLRFL
jgi:hypothetical protein